LKASIKAWEKKVELGYEAQLGPHTCPCCQKFRHTVDYAHVTCDGCPIKEHTGKHGCEDTPYEIIENTDTDEVS
jgi:hypothetical protein